MLVGGSTNAVVDDPSTTAHTEIVLANLLVVDTPPSTLPTKTFQAHLSARRWGRLDSGSDAPLRGGRRRASQASRPSGVVHTTNLERSIAIELDGEPRVRQSTRTDIRTW